jgi:hypothetical protein
MNVQQIRQEAIRRHLLGESLKTICTDLHVSRKWFYKWYRRSKSCGDDWYQIQSSSQ